MGSLDLYRIQESKNDPQKKKKLNKFRFLVVLNVLVWGLKVSLDVPYGSLGISKLQFLIKKRYIKNSQLFFFNFWLLKPLILIGSGSICESGFVFGSGFTWNAGFGSVTWSEFSESGSTRRKPATNLSVSCVSFCHSFSLSSACWYCADLCLAYIVTSAPVSLSLCTCLILPYSHTRKKNIFLITVC